MKQLKIIIFAVLWGFISSCSTNLKLDENLQRPIIMFQDRESFFSGRNRFKVINKNTLFELAVVPEGSYAKLMPDFKTIIWNELPSKKNSSFVVLNNGNYRHIKKHLNGDKITDFFFRDFSVFSKSSILYNYLKKLYVVDIESESIKEFKEFNYFVKKISIQSNGTQIALALNKSDDFRGFSQNLDFLAIMDVEKDSVIYTDIEMFQLFNWSPSGKMLLLRDLHDYYIVEYPELRKRKIDVGKNINPAYFIDDNNLVAIENIATQSTAYKQLVLYDITDYKVKDTLYCEDTYIDNLTLYQ